jgi:YD repeat-containing protein
MKVIDMGEGSGVQICGPEPCGARAALPASGRFGAGWYWGTLIVLVAALFCSNPSRAFAAGGPVTYSYDALGRLTEVMYPNGVTVTYGLDNAGNRISVATTLPPQAPGTPTISSITGSTATAAWSAPSGGTAPAGYEYTLNGGASWQSVGTALTANLSGFAAGTQYTFAVRAYDAGGARGPQSSTTFSTGPAAPGAVSISNIGGTTAMASWGAAAGAAGYEYSLNGGASWTNVGGTLTANLAGLSYATQYTFSVRSYNSAGTRSGSSSATFTTQADPAPSTPTGLGAVLAGNNQVILSWSTSGDSGGAGIAGYRVYRNGSQIGTTSSTSFSDTGVTPFNSYTYTVQAYDAIGTSSAQSSALPVYTAYQITDNGGNVLPSAASLYTSRTWTEYPSVNFWGLIQAYGSQTYVTVVHTGGYASVSACQDTGATVQYASGYQGSGCVVYAEPSVYGH